MNKSYFVIELLVFNFFFGIFFSQIHLSSKWESDSQNRFESWKTWNKHLLSLVNKVKSNKTRVEWSVNCISVISAKCHSWANCCVNINEPINSNELQLLNDEFPFEFSWLILQFYSEGERVWWRQQKVPEFMPPRQNLILQFKTTHSISF